MRSLGLIFVIFIGGAALAGDEATLAPRVADLDASVGRATRLLDDAKLFQDQMALAQSRFVAEGCALGACPKPRAAQLIVDVQAGGHAARDLLQSARAEVGRAERIGAAPMIQPLLDPGRREALVRLAARAERARRGWLVRTAWYEDRMAPWATRYKAEVGAACARRPGEEVAR